MSAAAVVVLAFALAIAALGAWGVAQPSALLAFVARWQSPRRVVLGVALRLAFGAALLAAAEGSRAPLALQGLGVVALATAAALPLVGAARVQAMVAWWSRRPPGFVRAWSAVALAFGSGLVWAVLP